MKVLFINPTPERCGVHQYGMRLFQIMVESKAFTAHMFPLPANEALDLAFLSEFDVVIYNRHGGIANAMHSAPYPIRSKQVAIFHEGSHAAPFDLWLFSDSSAPGYGNLVTIGRPMPKWNAIPRLYSPNRTITIGLSGLVGAWADTMVDVVVNQLPKARIRLHLAPSDHCDPHGALARAVGDRCRERLTNPSLFEAAYDFMTEPELLAWLERNDMNCYVRTPAGGPMSISSALDMALAVQRPIAINNHPMFRHIARVSPEICIENNTLTGIMALGLSPLIRHYHRNDRTVVLKEIEDALQSLFLSKPS